MNDSLPYPLTQIRVAAAQVGLDHRTLAKHLGGGSVRNGLTAERCRRAEEVLKQSQLERSKGQG